MRLFGTGEFQAKDVRAENLRVVIDPHTFLCRLDNISRSRSSAKTEMLKFSSFSFSVSVRFSSDPGTMRILIGATGPRRSISSVANLVQRLSLLGNITPDIASRTELLPEDCSPHTTISGRPIYRLIPCERRLSTTSRRLRVSLDWREALSPPLGPALAIMTQPRPRWFQRNSA